MVVGVIGLGVTGSLVTRELAKRGIKLIAIDVYKSLPSFNVGSSYIGNRVMRVLHEDYDLSSISNNTLQLLDQEKNIDYLKRTGHISIIPENKFELYIHYANEFNLQVKLLSKNQLLEYNGLTLQTNKIALFEANGGYIVPTLFIKYVRDQAKEYGAKLLLGKLASVNFQEKTILYDKESYKCDYLLICTGLMLPDTLLSNPV